MSWRVRNAQTQLQPSGVGPAVARFPVRENEKKKFSFQLPAELLRAIFEEYLRLDLPVQSLLEVNRQWRTVALETQSLWRRLLLSADVIPDSLRAGSVHACASEGQTTRILNRSGIITNLEVTFVLGPNEGVTPTPETRASLFKTVGHAALHRISFLCIIVNPEMTLPLVTASLKDVFQGTLPSLESLMIASAQAIGNLYEPLGALMDIIEESSTKLKSLYLENVNNDFILHASRKTFWTRLVRITIRNEFDSLDASLFSRSPHLEFLSLSGELVATPAPSPPPDLEFFSFSGELVANPPSFTAYLDSSLKTLIEFPELKWLRVSLISMGTLARLHLPKLHTMAIDCVQENYPLPAPPPGTLLLPALKVLQIDTVNPAIACINAPDLDTLCLSIPALKKDDTDNVLKAVFDGSDTMMRPKHLTIRGPVHDKHLIAALRFLGEKLVSLELDDQMPFSKSFSMEMTSSATARHRFGAATANLVPGMVTKLGTTFILGRDAERQPIYIPSYLSGEWKEPAFWGRWNQKRPPNLHESIGGPSYLSGEWKEPDFWGRWNQKRPPNLHESIGGPVTAASFDARITRGANANAGAVSMAGGATAPAAGSGGGRRYKPLLLPNFRCIVLDVHKNLIAQGGGIDVPGTSRRVPGGLPSDAMEVCVDLPQPKKYLVHKSNDHGYELRQQKTANPPKSTHARIDVTPVKTSYQPRESRVLTGVSSFHGTCSGDIGAPTLAADRQQRASWNIFTRI